MKFPSLLPVLALHLTVLPAVADSFPAPTPVTSPEDATDYWPAFSRDGKDLIFSRRHGDSPWLLFTVPFEGGSAKPLFDPAPSAVATRVSRSKTGRLAFAGANTIWVTDSKGENPKKLDLKNLTGNPSYPSWYADESRLLVVAYQKNEGGVLYRVDVASGDAVAVTDPKELRCGMPSVSPDGKSIIFAGQKNGGQVYDQTENFIWIIAGDQPARPLTPNQGRAANWSPDGKWIAYESTAGSPQGNRHAIFLISPDGRNNHAISSHEWDANHPVWSPDGKFLAVSIILPADPKRTRIATLRNPEAP